MLTKSGGAETTMKQERRMKSKLIRFTTTLPDGVMASYDKKTNILLVNKLAYDRLPDMHKSTVLKTTDTYMLEMEVKAEQEFVFNVT